MLCESPRRKPGLPLISAGLKLPNDNWCHPPPGPHHPPPPNPHLDWPKRGLFSALFRPHRYISAHLAFQCWQYGWPQKASLCFNFLSPTDLTQLGWVFNPHGTVYLKRPPFFYFFYFFFSPTGLPQLGWVHQPPHGRPRPPQEAPKRTQDHPKPPQDPPKTTPKAPKT